MKKIFILLICFVFGLQAKSQSLKEADFRFDNKGRPEIDRIFKTADGSMSMIYYLDATVSFFNNDKYTAQYVVHNIAQPLSMMIVRGEGQKDDQLFYSVERSSYTDKASGREYFLDQATVRKMDGSK